MNGDDLVIVIPSPCIEWQGARNAKGYGVRRLKGQGRNALVHRWVVEQVEGEPLAPGEIVMHLCDNPPCFRYDHLRRATQSENLRDAVEKGRASGHSAPGERNPAAKLTENDVRVIRASSEAQRALARRYGVSQSAIGHIRTGRTWGWLG